jgi:hypothetical protein
LMLSRDGTVCAIVRGMEIASRNKNATIFDEQSFFI